MFQFREDVLAAVVVGGRAEITPQYRLVQSHKQPKPSAGGRYLFTVVGTARCAVRAACSGASTWPSQRGARSVPPAARGRGRRSAASLPTNYVRTVNRYP